MSSAASVSLSPIAEDPTLFPICFYGARSPHCSLESILIYVAVPGAPTTLMQVSESDSIASVKLRIQACKGFVVRKQRLVFDGRELSRNNSLVKDYGVTDGKLLHLVIRLSDLRSITVKTARGKQYEFQVKRNRNIGYIKQQLAKRGESFCELEGRKLICDGEELDDQQMISDVCKDNDAVLHLLIHNSVKVRAEPVEKDFELSVIAADAKEKSGLDGAQIVASKLRGRDRLIEAVIVNSKVELSPSIVNMIGSVYSGLEKGNPPVMSSEGSGGAYFMQDAAGHRYVAVFKPIDEEPMAENNPRGLPLSKDGEGLKRGTRVGEGAFREVAAYILDHPVGGRRLSDEIGFAGVPPTVMVRCSNGGGLFYHPEGSAQLVKDFKIGSLQMYMKNYGSCEDMGPRAFPVEEVHKICVLDIRLANADRHAGNILVCKDEEGRTALVPIDHGYCLPENFEDCTFEWLYWPQAREPFKDEAIDYIRSLDAEEDIALLRFHGWEELSPECARTLRISTMLLKKGLERGLTPYDIGSIMCRETLKRESKIEEIIRQAHDTLLPGSSELALLECVSEILDHHLDQLRVQTNY